MAQLSPEPIPIAQPLSATNSPVATTLAISNVPPPTFVTVTVCGTLLLPRLRFPNVRLAGATWATGGFSGVHAVATLPAGWTCTSLPGPPSAHQIDPFRRIAQILRV
jgi:hypothetical protein